MRFLLVLPVVVGCTPQTGIGGPKATTPASTTNPDGTPTFSTPSTHHTTPGTTPTSSTPTSSTTPTSTTPTGSTTSETAIAACFGGITDPTLPNPDYAQFNPIVNSTCHGTNHQDIVDVDRVVFLGDSITVGTPPTQNDEMYRNILADSLATQFGLDPPGFFWPQVDVFSGETAVQHEGDFWSCAKWGARADNLMQDNSQVEDCFPEDLRDQKTLVIMTMGGNDINSLQGGFQDGANVNDLWDQTYDFTGLMRSAVEWMTDPAIFPNGNYVILANTYEYTDGTGDVTACPGAALAGYQTVTDPALQEMVVYGMEQYMSIAVDNQVDMLFLEENFCGHGYKRDDATGRCYKGPGADLWFDLTCIHPNPVGHGVLADMFMDTVLE